MALHAEEGRNRRRRNTMLACARLRDDAFLAHALGEERLPECVIDLMRARMQQILTLEIDIRLAVVLRQPLGKVQIRRTSAYSLR